MESKELMNLITKAQDVSFDKHGSFSRSCGFMGALLHEAIMTLPPAKRESFIKTLELSIEFDETGVA